MTQTDTQDVPRQQRRHVVGFILGSMGVGVLGLVTAIAMSVSGILNSFTEVSEAYDDIFETGEEIGHNATPVELEDANYTLLSFTTSEEQPSLGEQAALCTITDEQGQRVATQTSTQPVSGHDMPTAHQNLRHATHVVYAHFKAVEGTYALSCEQFGVLSDDASYSMGGTAVWGVAIGLGSVAIAGVLFLIGVVNHARNRKMRPPSSRKLITYDLDYS